MRTPRICLALLFLAAACGTAVSAPLLDVDVIGRDATGPLPVYWHKGDPYVEGEAGERYSVRLTNRSSERVLAVLSVDGVNAVSGETASPDQAGYVLDPGQSFLVAGWRKSTRDVARFFFTRLSNSYAAMTGRADNVGVIGVAVFRERAAVAPPSVSLNRATPESNPSDRTRAGARDSAASAPSAMAEAAAPASPLASAPKSLVSPTPSSQPRVQQEPLGTGHGERETSPVRLVNFERANASPDESHVIWYDSREGLVERGVIARSPHPRVRPQPFPAQFVPDPPCCGSAQQAP